jgi:hypothetical protein
MATSDNRKFGNHMASIAGILPESPKDVKIAWNIKKENTISPRVI